MTDMLLLEERAPQLMKALERNDFDAAKELLTNLHPADIADILDTLNRDLRAQAFNLLDMETASEVLDELVPEARFDLIERINEQRLSDLLEELPSDDAAEILGDLPTEQAKALIELMEPEEAEEIRELLNYPDGTAGRLMTESFVRIRGRWTVAETLEYLRQADPETETFAYLYAVDDEDHLVGVVPLRKLVTAPRYRTVRELMTEQVISVSVDTDQEDVARVVAKYDFVAVPVVDRQNRLVGIITIDDVMDILQEEATEDIQRLGGSEPLDQPYMGMSIFRVARKRAGWLLLLFVAQAFTGTVLQWFEHELATVVALTFFIPLLIGTGGNSGSQVVTTVIRALAVGEVHLRDAFRVIRREVATGIVLGALMALVGFIRAATWGTGGDLAITVGLALIAIVIWANFLGAIFPLLASRLKLDPTLMSAPLIATFVDATGLFIYFSIAKLVMGI